MSRGDTRLLVAILGTAVVSSVTTILLSHRCDSEREVRLDAIEHRLGALETPVAKPTPVEVAVVPVEAVDPLPPAPGGELAVCDEVACVLDNYESKCCAKFDKRTKRPSGLPFNIDRTMISEAIAGVKSRIMACGAKSSVKGVVKVHVKIAPDGSIASATLKQTPDPALGECVIEGVSRAKFAKTETGGSFSYPFVF